MTMKLRNVRIVSITFLLCASGMFSFIIYQEEIAKRKAKEDLIELSKIKYGLFSVDEWKRILADIITRKVEAFNFEGTNREEMRQKISVFLYDILNDLKTDFYNNRSRSLLGFLQSSVASLTGIFEDIERNVPRFTEQIIDFMDNPENRGRIREYIITKLNDYADKTFSQTDYATHNAILARYNFPDRPAAIKSLEAMIESRDKEIRPYVIALFCTTFFVVLYLLFFKALSGGEYLLLTAISLNFLLSGLLLPMIEIDARISTMQFTLLGESIAFQDQVLYFKSKSILEVVQLMITQTRMDLLFVGFLVFTFSVLFPLLKLASSVLYIYSPHLQQSRFVRFMVFKTGKWSMADVMVVAVFMAYIGFTGIITEQLKQIESIAQNIDILTTNRSSLQMGFFSFTAFAIISLLISHRLQYSFRVSA